MATAMISASAIERIRGLLRPWMDKHLRQMLARAPHMPFHQALFPGRDLSIWGEERSFSTALGNRFQAIALILAQDVHGNGHSNYTVIGNLPNATLSTISAIVSDLRDGRLQMNGHFPELVARVQSGYTGDLVERKVRFDLFYQDRMRAENYFEIKSPKPNRGQCLEATERILLVHGLRAGASPSVNAFYAMPYNPYGEEKAQYAWHHATQLLDIQNEVLIGCEFWDYVGGPGTYTALLKVFEDVGEEAASGLAVP